MTCSFDPIKIEGNKPVKCPVCNNWIIPGHEHINYFDHDDEIKLVNRINEFWGTGYKQPEELTRYDLLYYLNELFFDHDLNWNKEE